MFSVNHSCYIPLSNSLFPLFLSGLIMSHLHVRIHQNISLGISSMQATGPNRPTCKQAIITAHFFILPAIREIMGIIGLMSSKLKMGSRFPRGSRLLYEGHSVQRDAVSNSPAVQILFTTDAITAIFFVYEMKSDHQR